MCYCLLVILAFADRAGVVQTFSHYVNATTLQGYEQVVLLDLQHHKLPLNNWVLMVADFGANSAHPLKPYA
jgi:hypothetical protein